jgi:hypothetical protein
VSITEGLLEWKSSGSRSGKPRLTVVGICCAEHATTSLHPQKLALTSLTRGDRSVCIVRLRTKATEFFSFKFMYIHAYVCLSSCLCVLTLFMPACTHISSSTAKYYSSVECVLKLSGSVYNLSLPNSRISGLAHPLQYIISMVW